MEETSKPKRTAQTAMADNAKLWLQSAKGSLYPKITISKPSDTLTLLEVLMGIKEGAFSGTRARRRKVLEVLNDKTLSAKEKDRMISEIKARAEAFAFSGTFKLKALDTIQTYNGALVIDIDDFRTRKEALAALESLADHPNIVSAHISAGQLGVKVLLYHTSGVEQHAQAYQQAQSLVETLLKLKPFSGGKADRSGKNVNRQTWLTYSPELFINEGAEPLQVKAILGSGPSKPLSPTVALQTTQSTIILSRTPIELLEECLEFCKKTKALVKGNRNNFYHYLASEANRWGIPRLEAFKFIIKHGISNGLGLNELIETCKSAYRRKSEFGTSVSLQSLPIESFISSLRSEQLGDSDLLALIFANRVVRVEGQGIWRRYNGTHWVGCSDSTIKVAAARYLYWQYSFARKQFQQMADSAEDEKMQKEYSDFATLALKRAKSCVKAAYISKVLDFYRGIVQVPRESFDTNKKLLNLLNGTLDLETRELKAHDAGDFITKLLRIEFDPNATCPKWESFISTISSQNEEIVTYLSEIFGSALDPSQDRQYLYIFHGPGNNGKSTLLRVLAYVFGDYYQQAPADLLIVRGKEGAVRDALVAQMEGARLITFSEIPMGQRLQESFIKDITGGDIIDAKFMAKNPFRFVPDATFVIAGNHDLEVESTVEGIWRRLKYIEMTHSFAGQERPMSQVLAELKAEAPGILNWLLAGHQSRCQKVKLGQPIHPKSIEDATNRRRFDSDQVARFIAWWPNKGPGLRVKAMYFYDQYKKWWEAEGEQPKVRDNRMLLERVRHLGYRTVKSNGTTCIQGLGHNKGAFGRDD